MNNILIVDDEIRIREVIREYCNMEGYNTFCAQDGNQAISVVEKNNIDLVVLDIMMPVMDGFTTAKKIKEIKDLPIIMLSARNQEDDKLSSFQIGVDDYVTKPFSPKELMARIKVILQRYNKLYSNVLKNEGIVIDLDQHIVTIDDQTTKLTNKEFDLLVYFIKNTNRVINRDELLNNIWGYEFSGFDRTIDAHIKMLRKSLKNYSDKIVTVRGVGYKFVSKD